MARKSRRTRRLRVVNPDCAGIDIGKDRHFVAVDPERSDEPVRSFGSFTRDLEEMAAWLASCGVTKVAMESTSVYWIPVYETLERAGFEVMLVPPRMTKQIGGRKSDVLDCQWIWQLMSYGLLRGAFRPGDEFCPLRSYARQMRRLTGDRSPLRPAHAEGADRDERQARLGEAAPQQEVRSSRPPSPKTRAPTRPENARRGKTEPNAVNRLGTCYSRASTCAWLRLGRGSNGGLCLRRLGLELAAGGVKRPFAHWRAVAAPDVEPENSGSNSSRHRKTDETQNPMLSIT